ncbi:MAG: DUF4126 domain-containing protein [Alphaproteobacteria bacterium]|nr:MAG: DUF4126 domain-containing protein [Alphaproteobacteria bacterium]
MMGIVESIALSMGAAWGSGINLYAAVFTLGFLHNTDKITLPPDLVFLGDPLVMAAAGLMYLVEFCADKIPGIDTLWDGIHSFIRIPAGAVLAAGAVGELGAGAQFAALLVGGTLAAATHATKAGTRAVVNTSPEPFSNWALSIGEDIAVFAGVWAALTHPWIFLGLLVAFILFMAWILPKIWRGIKKVFRWLFRSQAGQGQGPPAQAPPAQATPQAAPPWGATPAAPPKGATGHEEAPGEASPRPAEGGTRRDPDNRP